MKAAKILVIEDNEITRKIVKLTLEDAGHRVWTATDGRSARELLAKGCPDLVLLDLKLPDLNGSELVRLIRQDPANEHLKIVAFTGFAHPSEEARVVGMGFDGYIVKPIEPSRLLQVVNGYLENAPNLAGRAGKGKRLLVADDDPVQLRLARAIFTDAGFQVTAAGNGTEALEIARKARPDVIVSDILMPELDGFQLCLAVKNDPAIAHIPVILASSQYLDSDDRQLALSLGASDLVVREPKLVLLLDAVVAALNAPPSAAPAAPRPHLQGEYTHRIIRQLERQATMNQGLSEQCTLQAAALSVLSATSAAVADATDIEAVLPELLGQCLDAAGLSSGALSLRDAEGACRLMVQLGFKQAQREGLEKGITALRGYLDSGKLIVLPSVEIPRELSEPFLNGIDRESALIVPLISRRVCLGALVLTPDAARIDVERWRAFAATVATQFALAISLSRRVHELETSNARYQSLMEHAMDGICVLKPDGTITEVNPSMAKLLGMPGSEIVGSHFQKFVVPEMLERTGADFRKIASEGGVVSRGVKLLRPDGREAFADFTATLVTLGDRQQVFTIGHDVTERIQTEAQLRQAQKMEAVGQLAGGIAHDFNNILGVVLMHCDSLLEKLAQAKAEPDEDVLEIKGSAERAAAMTRQLLVFSRKQILEPKILNLSESAGKMEQLLRRLIGEDIKLVTKFDPELKPACVDSSQFDQIVMNLAVNASDAMPKGGTLTLETCNTDLDDNHALRHVGVKPGPYVMLKVSDTGCGMDAATQARIFEPFFTTKGEGKGTGLGLATVFGIVKQSDGDISVYSELGKGAVFKIYFPAHAGEAADSKVTEAPVPTGGGSETILVVEDEARLRAITTRTLRESGYQVLEATDGAQALAFCAGHKGRIDLIMTDVIMPNVSGPEFIRRLAGTPASRQVKVLFLSGYSAGKLSEHGFSEHEVRFLEKPYTKKTLLAKIREILSNGG